MANVFSVGDVLIGLGVVVVIGVLLALAAGRDDPEREVAAERGTDAGELLRNIEREERRDRALHIVGDATRQQGVAAGG